MDRSSIAIVACAIFTAFSLSTDEACGQFSIVVDAPPTTILPNSAFGSNTQVNLADGSEVGGWLYFGGQTMPVANSQLNVRGGRANVVEAWTGSDVNVTAGSIRTANLLGAEGTMSGRTVERWNLFAQSRLIFSGGAAANVATAGLDTGIDPDRSLLIVTGGQIGALDATGDVVISGGAVGDGFVFRGGGYVDIAGGSVGNHFEAGYEIVGAIPNSDEPVVVDSGGRVTMRGGSIGDHMVLYGGRDLKFSGGFIGQAFHAMEGSHVSIIGSEFLVDGVALERPGAVDTIPMTQRSVILSGILANGQEFQFDLNDQLGQPGRGDFFSPMATVSVTFVPEPQAAIYALPLVACLLVARIRERPKIAQFRSIGRDRWEAKVQMTRIALPRPVACESLSCEVYCLAQA